jgi:hypothetical protein
VGMTAQYPEGADEVLFQSPADWVSPGARFLTGDGRKVVLNDTDHSYFWIALKQDGVAAQRAWVWKNFTRGNQCLIGGAARPLLGAASQGHGADADLCEPDGFGAHGSPR